MHVNIAGDAMQLSSLLVVYVVIEGVVRMYSSILVPVDLAHESSWVDAIPEAITMARAGQASLMVMTVVRQMSMMFEARYLNFQVEEALTEARNRLQDVVARYADDRLPIMAEVGFGPIGPQIVATARNHAVDLIVMTAHRPEMRDYLIGPNAAYVARHARCSVLIMRK